MSGFKRRFRWMAAGTEVEVEIVLAVARRPMKVRAGRIGVLLRSGGNGLQNGNPTAANSRSVW